MSGRRHLGLQVSTWAVIGFLHIPILIVFLYAFTTESSAFTFPPPGFTLDWFGVAWNNGDVRDAMWLSMRVAATATAIEPITRAMAAAAVWRRRFFGREAVSLFIVLPIALPGIVTGIALRSAISIGGIPFSFWTIVIGHATFAVAIAYNNVVARMRRTSTSLLEASADLGANGWQTFRHVLLPQIRPALIAGGMLAFALSFDEIIVTTFTAGNQQTLPIWMFSSLVRPRQRPITNVVALVVVAITFIPIVLATRLTRGSEGQA